MKRILIFALALACNLLATHNALAQNKFDGQVELDATVHDFGDIYISDGPVSHTFTVTNISGKDILILSVVSSCGCTDVAWTRETLKPGAKGIISATYSNDEGPYPFDKTLTAYFDALKKPVVLHLRGTSCEKARPLSETYPVKFGSFGLKSAEIKAGNLSQGEQKSGVVKVANHSSKPVKVTFQDISEGLTLSVTPNPIPAGGTADLHYNVTSDTKHWGKNWYYATPVVDGRTMTATGSPAPREKADGDTILSDENTSIGKGTTRIGVWAFTKENFSGISKEDKAKGASPVFENTNFNMGRVKAGRKVTAAFAFTNKGKSPLKVYSIDAETSRINAAAVSATPAGAKGSINIDFDTTGLPKGPVTVVLNVTTNSPIRPLVTLTISGVIN